MNGFIAFLPVDSSLNKLKIAAHKLKPIQSGGKGSSSSTSSSSSSGKGVKKQGQTASTTVKLFSPKEQVVEQAKDNLKRNREEAVIDAPDGIKILEVKKVAKKVPTKKPGKKSTKLHKKYGKKN